MSDELKYAADSGGTYYARVFNDSGQVWNTSGTPAFEAWAAGNVTDYDIALTDKSSGEYIGDFPTDIAVGTYYVIVYEQAGGSPAITDLVASSVGMIWWDGSAEIEPSNEQDVLDAHSTTDALINAIAVSVAGILNQYREGE